MYIPILLASFGFIGFFIWYLASEDAQTRRVAGLGAIIASLLTCGMALIPAQPAIHLGLDLQGGTEFLLEVQGDNITPAALEQASSVIRKRLDILGTREISIQPEGTNRLKIQIPGLEGAERVATRDLITRVGQARAAHGSRQHAWRSCRRRRPTVASCRSSTRPTTRFFPW